MSEPLGHCLGGQLMSRAFGGAVRANPVKEIGWGEVRVADGASPLLRGAPSLATGALVAGELFPLVLGTEPPPRD